MSDDKITTFDQFLHLASQWEDVQGCSDADIERLKEAQNVSYLPKTYTQVLRIIGRTGMRDFLDADGDYHELLNMKTVAKRIFSSGSDLIIPDDAFIFYNHHGISVLLFETASKNDDPPIYNYAEADIKRKVADSMSEYWVDLMNFYFSHGVQD